MTPRANLNAALRALALALSAALAACGPGVGGTGTGEEGRGLQAFGAEARPLCGSTLALLLGCTPASAAPASGAGQLAPSADSHWAGADGTVQLAVQGNAATLTAECGGLRFRALWGQQGSAEPLFYGWLEADGGERPALMLLRPSGEQLLLTLLEADGSVRLGPLLVQRQPAATSLRCP